MERLESLLGTKDINSWQDKFIRNVVDSLQRHNGSTTHFSDKQVEKIDEIFEQFFAD